MAKTALRGQTAGIEAPFPRERRRGIERRLGLNVPASWWPAAPSLKALEASGFTWVQVHAPPRALLCDPAGCRQHALRVRRELDTTGLRLVLHGPDDLSAGEPDMDRALDSLLAYASTVRAELIVYHGANFEDEPRAADRLAWEERSLRARAGRAEELGLTIAIENLAPVYPGPAKLCHRPQLVAELVDRLDTQGFGMCFDAGHAHIVSDRLQSDVPGLLAPVLDRVVLFHLHDNYGSRGGGSGVDPMRLDLHLPPGRGTVPWKQFAGLLAPHPAPLMLEVHPPHRPRPDRLATISGGVLEGE
jgi:sugar phosphate isomerase/epimerase